MAQTDGHGDSKTSDNIEEEDKFRYIDDLEIIELIKLSGILIEYDVRSHVPSDIDPHQRFFATRNTSNPILSGFHV